MEVVAGFLLEFYMAKWYTNNMDLSNVKKINIITGHYGSGKTNFSVNLALALADKGEKVSIVDLDIVNPYFRTADFSELFEDRGITLAASVYANSNLDIPAISFDVERLANEEGYLIIDVGGDDDGAMALGRYSEILNSRDDVQMLYVINAYRYLVKEPEDTVALLKSIEAASRMKCTGLVNNSNLGDETNAVCVKNSLSFAKKVSELSGLPMLYTCVPNGETVGEREEFPVKRYVKAPWEE